MTADAERPAPTVASLLADLEAIRQADQQARDDAHRLKALLGKDRP